LNVPNREGLSFNKSNHESNKTKLTSNFIFSRFY
jgi:hypothetical protein